MAEYLAAQPGEVQGEAEGEEQRDGGESAGRGCHASIVLG
jgi:hypothetical protein